MLSLRRIGTVLLLAVAVGGCETAAPASAPTGGEVVVPPFEVRGNADGLLLVWFDEEGTHTATQRDEIPEEHRELVRVDDLRLPPEDRLAPELVYVADLREAGDDGTYTVRRMGRDDLDQQVESTSTVEVQIAEAPDAPSPPGADPGTDPNADVIVYGASWCNACRGAAAFLRERQIPFVERDVEREPGARQAMLQAAAAAGVRTNGIPVIDFRGQIIAGFNRGALEAAIARGRTAI